MCDDPTLIPAEFKAMPVVARRTEELNNELVVWTTKLTRLRKLEHRSARRAAEAARRESAVRTMRGQRAALRASIEKAREVQGTELTRHTHSAKGSREWRKVGPAAARAALAEQRVARAKEIRGHEKGWREEIAAQPRPTHGSSRSARLGRGKAETEALVERRRASKQAELKARLAREAELRERVAEERAMKAERAAAHRQRRLDNPLRARELRRGVLESTLSRRAETDLDKCSVLYYKNVKPIEAELQAMQAEEKALRLRLAAADKAAETAEARLSKLSDACPARELRATAVPRGAMSTQPGSPSRGTGCAVLADLDALHTA